MKIGALRINEAMSSIEKHTLNFYKVLEEYIEAHVENVESFQGNSKNSQYAVVTGGSESLARLIGGLFINEMTIVSRELFNAAYKKASEMSVEALALACDVSVADAETIAPSLILIRKFFDMTEAKEVVLPHVTLVDGIIAEHALMMTSKTGRNCFEEDILSNATHIAKRYQYNQLHTEYVMNRALELFDSLSSVHGMDIRDRFLLQIATLLHDIGKFIGADPHYVYSYNIIKASQLAGFSDSELATIANIARFHSAEEPASNNESLRKLDTSNQIKAVKLIAIIRLADALDTSHKQKIQKVKVDLKERGVCKVKGVCRVEAALEQWTFQMKAVFFHEVFGLQPILTITNISGKPEE